MAKGKKQIWVNSVLVRKCKILAAEREVPLTTMMDEIIGSGLFLVKNTSASTSEAQATGKETATAG